MGFAHGVMSGPWRCSAVYGILRLQSGYARVRVWVRSERRTVTSNVFESIFHVGVHYTHLSPVPAGDGVSLLGLVRGAREEFIEERAVWKAEAHYSIVYVVHILINKNTITRQKFATIQLKLLIDHATISAGVQTSSHIPSASLSCYTLPDLMLKASPPLPQFLQPS